MEIKVIESKAQFMWLFKAICAELEEQIEKGWGFGDMGQKAELLKFRQNLHPDTIQLTKEFRLDFYNLVSKMEDKLGTSRELSEAFTCMQTALFFINAHCCYNDAQATKEPLLGE